MRRSVAAAAVLAAAAAAVLALRARPAPPVLFVGGPILTMDSADRVVEAIAIDHGTIAATGSRSDLQAWAREHDATVVDLHGRALLPGFVDAHSHFPACGLFDTLVHVGSPPLANVTTIDELVQTMARGSASSRRGPWIVGWGYDDTALTDLRHPTRDDLDRVSRDEPVAVFHISMHVAVVNSAGLAALGLGDASPDPQGGHLVRDEHGHLTGLLEEEAMRPLLTATMVPSTLDAVLATRRAAATYLAAGVTTAQDGAATKDQVSGLILLSRAGLLPLRLVIWPEGDTALAIADKTWRPGTTDPDWVRIGAAKFIADGSIQAYTAYLSEPYFRGPATSGAAQAPSSAPSVPSSDAKDASLRGFPRIPRERLFELVAHIHAAGGQVAIHGNGDAEIDDILDAIEAAQKAFPRDDARHVIVHAQMAREDQLDRMKALGVIPSFFELHTWYWGDRHRDRFLGPERAARISPLKSAEARGLPFTLHADTPVVPMEPLRMLAAAVTRRTASGAVLGPEQRIGVASALRALTINAAHEMFLENRVGSLEAGKLADLVILDRSPLAPDVDLDNLHVVETWVGGRRVFPAN
ncbi:MAG TPA: amidohydrolase [Candidatus Binatia bacterium]|jgi:hypothetical protein